MTYETITVEQLTNRASNAYTPGCCGIPETPDQFFAVMYFTAGEWHNGHETIDEVEAAAKLAQYRRMRGGESETTKIVLVVAKQAEPVIEEPVQVEAVEEVQEVVEQSVEASTASTDEQVEVAKSGKFEVIVEAVKSVIAYRGDSLATAKATVAAHIGKCNRVQTRIHLEAGESFWVYPGKRANGLAWDSHEQWLADLHAGKFDTAYARDYVNDLVLQGKQSEAKREANWFQERGINV